jgi:hypothetical protein
MLKKLESFFFGRIFGRVVSRLAVSGAAYLAGQAAGVGIELDPDQVSAALIAGANALYTYISEWRAKRAAAAAAPAPAA